jgi:hypothetical protein
MKIILFLLLALPCVAQDSTSFILSDTSSIYLINDASLFGSVYGDSTDLTINCQIGSYTIKIKYAKEDEALMYMNNGWIYFIIDIDRRLKRIEKLLENK